MNKFIKTNKLGEFLTDFNSSNEFCPGRGLSGQTRNSVQRYSPLKYEKMDLRGFKLPSRCS